MMQLHRQTLLTAAGSVQLTTFLGTRWWFKHGSRRTIASPYAKISARTHTHTCSRAPSLLPDNHTVSTFRRRCSFVERLTKESTWIIMKVPPRVTTMCTLIHLPEQIVGRTIRCTMKKDKLEESWGILISLSYSFLYA